MTARTILCVEDDPDILHYMTLVLEEEGYRVLQAANGRIAYDLLRRLPPAEYPDCILLDLMMPEMNGRELLARLQAERPGDLARIPVILVTAEGRPEENPAGLGERHSKISKPMNLETLLAVVARQSSGDFDS